MSTPITPKVRGRLQMQGYACPNEQAFREVVPWTRFSPALCSTIGAVGTVLASPIILGALVPMAALGAVFPVHPFDLIYNHGIRHMIGTEPLPKNGAPRRFACAVATVWLGATAAAFWMEAMIVGYVLGTLFVAVSGLVATTHICIPSMVYRRVFRQPVAATV